MEQVDGVSHYDHRRSGSASRSISTLHRSISVCKGALSVLLQKERNRCITKSTASHTSGAVYGLRCSPDCISTPTALHDRANIYRLLSIPRVTDGIVDA